MNDNRPPPFVPEISPETQATIDALKQRYGVTTATEVLRCVLADARKTADGYHRLPPLTPEE